jgi:hypothetical protein
MKEFFIKCYWCDMLETCTLCGTVHILKGMPVSAAFLSELKLADGLCSIRKKISIID